MDTKEIVAERLAVECDKHSVPHGLLYTNIDNAKTAELMRRLRDLRRQAGDLADDIDDMASGG